MKFLPAASTLAAASSLVTNNLSSAFVTPRGGGSSTVLQPVGTSVGSLFSSTSITTARFSAVAPQDAQQQQQQLTNDFGGVLTGEVLSILRPDSNSHNNGGAAASSSFAVVKVCEEDLLPNSAYEVAKAMATAEDASTNKNNVEEEGEEEKVELASALFGKPMPEAVKKSTDAAAKNGGAIGE